MTRRTSVRIINLSRMRGDLASCPRVPAQPITVGHVPMGDDAPIFRPKRKVAREVGRWTGGRTGGAVGDRTGVGRDREHQKGRPAGRTPWCTTGCSTILVAQPAANGANEMITRPQGRSSHRAEKFKAADDPLRIVFVCTMWITGFDAPSVSKLILDRHSAHRGGRRAAPHQRRVRRPRGRGARSDG